MSRRLAWSIVLLGWIANTVLWAVVIPPFPGHYVVCLAAEDLGEEEEA